MQSNSSGSKVSRFSRYSRREKAIPDPRLVMEKAGSNIGRTGKPDDVAYGVLYLASDESSFITGSELVIDGGYIAQ